MPWLKLMLMFAGFACKSPVCVGASNFVGAAGNSTAVPSLPLRPIPLCLHTSYIHGSYLHSLTASRRGPVDTPSHCPPEPPYRNPRPSPRRYAVLMLVKVHLINGGLAPTHRPQSRHALPPVAIRANNIPSLTQFCPSFFSLSEPQRKLL